jgi:hypothetical protein
MRNLSFFYEGVDLQIVSIGRHGYRSILVGAENTCSGLFISLQN